MDTVFIAVHNFPFFNSHENIKICIKHLYLL